MKQVIKCDVRNCKYCNCDNDICELKEIKVSNSGCDKACQCEATMCASFKERKK